MRDFRYGEKIFDIYLFKTYHEDNIKYIIVIPVYSFYNLTERINIHINGYDFNRLSGGLNNLFIEDYKYSDFVDEDLEYIDFENSTIRQSKSGKVNYQKYLKIYKGEEIYILREFEKILNSEFTIGKVLNYLEDNRFKDENELYLNYQVFKTNDLNEDIEEWEEMKGIIYEEEEYQKKLNDLNNDGLSDFDDDTYWNID